MGLFLDQIIQPVNLVLTVILGLFAIYWVLVILGGLDIDALEFDFDLDGDVDLELDLNADAHVGASTQILKFFNIGEVPLMIILNVIVFVTWALCIIANYLFPFGSLLVSALIVIPSFILAIFASALITRPLRSVFRNFNQIGLSKKRVLGQICKIRTGEVRADFGQADLNISGSSITLEVRVSDDSQNLRRGDSALVVKHDKANGAYLVRKIEEVKMD